MPVDPLEACTFGFIFILDQHLYMVYMNTLHSKGSLRTPLQSVC